MHIGANIAELRKAMGLKQEDIAKAAGVSAQAVSKWENGGTPDTELLPLVADYFGVTIDRLFGRNTADYGDIEAEVTKYIAQPLDDYGDGVAVDQLPDEAHDLVMERARAICGSINTGMFGTSWLKKVGFSTKRMFDEIQNNSADDLHLYAKIITDSGISMMSLVKSFPYFMLFPEPQRGWNENLPDMEDYRKVFSAFSEPDVLECLYFIHTRESKKNFSLGYFSKMTKLSTERAERLLEILTEMKYIEVSVIELDDAEQTFYSFVPNHVFVMLLLLMITYMRSPKANIEMDIRKKPFFRKEDEAE
jgi:transcriptional regulator with XRE-family HTH domain